MSSTMRGTIRTVAQRAIRGTAVGLGGLALAVGAAACSGEEEPAAPTTEEQPAQQEEPAEEETTGEETTEESSEDSAASDGGGDTAGEANLDGAKERFVEFLQVVDDGDYEAACGFTLDPTTGEPPAGETLQQCAESLEAEIGANGSIQPGTFDAVEPTMLQAEENADGAVTVIMGGEPFPLPMVEHTDGQWYFHIEL